MAQTIALVASVAFTHQGRTLAVGETFDASPIEAAALTYQRKARFAPKGHTYARRDMVPARPMFEPVPEQTPESVAEPRSQRSRGGRRRTQRRDMVAED